MVLPAIVRRTSIVNIITTTAQQTFLRAACTSWLFSATAKCFLGFARLKTSSQQLSLGRGLEKGLDPCPIQVGGVGRETAVDILWIRVLKKEIKK